MPLLLIFLWYERAQLVACACFVSSDLPFVEFPRPLYITILWVSENSSLKIRDLLQVVVYSRSLPKAYVINLANQCCLTPPNVVAFDSLNGVAFGCLIRKLEPQLICMPNLDIMLMRLESFRSQLIFELLAKNDSYHAFSSRLLRSLLVDRCCLFCPLWGRTEAPSLPGPITVTLVAPAKSH